MDWNFLQRGEMFGQNLEGYDQIWALAQAYCSSSPIIRCSYKLFCISSQFLSLVSPGKRRKKNLSLYPEASKMRKKYLG